MPKPSLKLSAYLASGLLSMTSLASSAYAGITKGVEDALNFYHYGNNGAVKIDLNYRY